MLFIAEVMTSNSGAKKQPFNNGLHLFFHQHHRRHSGSSRLTEGLSSAYAAIKYKRAVLVLIAICLLRVFIPERGETNKLSVRLYSALLMIM